MDQDNSGLSPNINPVPVSQGETHQTAQSTRNQTPSATTNTAEEIIETSVAEVVTPTTEPKSPKKSKKSRVATLCAIFCAILAVAGISFGVFFYLDANNKSTDNAKLRAELDLIKNETGIELVEQQQGNTVVATIANTDNHVSEVKEVVNKLYSVADDINSGMTGYRTIKIYNDGTINTVPNSLIRVNDNGVYTQAEESYGIEVIPQHNEDGSYSKFDAMWISKLEELGFTKTIDLMVGELYENEKNNITCVLDTWQIVCSHADWIKDETLSVLDKLSEVYFLSEGVYPRIIGSSYKISDSNVSPYQTLITSVSNAAGLFYRTSPNADWQFFTGTQGILSCSDYNTQDLKNAFAGEVCYDEAANQESTVQP